jgi:hypothetical protein
MPATKRNIRPAKRGLQIQLSDPYSDQGVGFTAVCSF